LILIKVKIGQTAPSCDHSDWARNAAGAPEGRLSLAFRVRKF